MKKKSLKLLVCMLVIIFYILVKIVLFENFMYESTLVFKYYIFFLFMTTIYIISFVIFRKTNKSAINNIIKFIVIVNFVILLLMMIITVFNLSLNLNFSLSYSRLWMLLSVFSLTIMSFLLLVLMFKNDKWIKLLFKISIIMIVVPLIAYIGEDYYYDSFENGMIVSDYYGTEEIEAFDNSYVLDRGYKVKLVGDNDYYELNDISEGVYVVVYNSLNSDIQIRPESKKKYLIENFDYKVLAYNSNTKVELSKNINENEFFYFYKIQPISDYSDENIFYLSNLYPGDLFITYSENSMYVYTRREDNIYKYTMENTDDNYLQFGEYEYVGDLTSFEDQNNGSLVIDLLDNSYHIYMH